MLLLSSCWGSVLPPHYAEIFYSDVVTRGVKMVIYWGGCLEIQDCAANDANKND